MWTDVAMSVLWVGMIVISLICGLLTGNGEAVGAAAVLLTYLGNPDNMGFCIACFLRDIAGALNLQRAGFDAEAGTGIVQYIRPEIIGLVLGSTAIAFARKEFRPKGGSSPMLRFVVAVFVMIGALVFLGCPLRMVIRIGGGDLNAVVGLAGFAIGILIGIQFLQRGFSLRRAYQQSMAEGLIFPVLMAALLALLLIGPDFIVFSAKVPAPWPLRFWRLWLWRWSSARWPSAPGCAWWAASGTRCCSGTSG